jgi:hypothetical protein
MLLFDGCVNSRLVVAGHSAIGVWHDEHSIYTEKVRSQDERSQHVVRYSSTCVTQNLGVTRLHANNRKWANTRIHASDDCKSFTRGSGEFGMLKTLNKGLVRRNDVREFVIWESHHSEDTTRSVGNIQACRVMGVKQI